MSFIRYFNDITLKDIPLVGGKNASLGQMVSNLGNEGVTIPQGFAVTTEAYWYHLKYNNLYEPLKKLIDELKKPYDVTYLQKIGFDIRHLILSQPLPPDVIRDIKTGYEWLNNYYHTSNLDVAVRSSATAEDLPKASFAGQQESYLNIRGIDQLLESTLKCMASLFTDRAIAYRQDHNFDHFKVAISVGIQKMVRSDLASAGVIFTIDTDTGFKDIIIINSSYGLGEGIVQGIVNPDEFHVHKPTLKQGFAPIIKKFLGNKEVKFIYTQEIKHPIKSVPVKPEQSKHFSLRDDEILTLAKHALKIEDYYSELYNHWTPMDIEWAKDGLDGKLYIVQARLETVYRGTNTGEQLIKYSLKPTDTPLHVILTGLSIGKKIAYGRARILKSIHEHTLLQEGDILITQMTDPDWVPLMKKASAIVTNLGGRTCHAAIVSRELGIPAIIGTNEATHIIKDGSFITVDCSQGSIGYIYEGAHEFTIEKFTLKTIPTPPVPILVNIADPDRAYELSFLPVDGVGLARVEFIITNFIKVHPMAAYNPEVISDEKIRNYIEELAIPYGDTQNFYIETLAQGIATIAAAFYPKPVIVRLSDFKSNEYRNLLGGNYFEPQEENPMLGFRGAVRYCDPRYAPAFALECAAIKKAREHMGLKNIKILVPFVRTIAEAQCTIDALEKHNLIRKQNDLEILMMCEIPSNVLLLKEFSDYFDGFSIGSNDLTQFTLAVDRDSGLLSSQFDEQDPAMLKMFEIALSKAHEVGKYIGICGQAPSDYPFIADFLIERGIDSLSLNPDSVIPFLLRKESK